MFAAARGKEKGNWYRTLRDGHSLVVFVCPTCGGRGTVSSTLGLVGNHAIDLQGQVSPSIVCDCGFHDFVQLVGWTF